MVVEIWKWPRPKVKVLKINVFLTEKDYQKVINLLHLEFPYKLWPPLN
jgi:hypothetical protein